MVAVAAVTGRVMVTALVATLEMEEPPATAPAQDLPVLAEPVEVAVMEITAP